MPRPTHAEMFMAMAWLVSARSTCNRGQVGAVIVDDRRPVSIGYNGAPPRMKHCTEVGCDPEDGCERTIHAEANAIAWAARRGISVEGATMYSTHSPCRMCANLIASAGIDAFIYDTEYRLGRLDILDAVNIKVLKFYGVKPGYVDL